MRNIGLKNKLLLIAFNLFLICFTYAQETNSKVKFLNDHQKSLKGTLKIDAINTLQKKLPSENIKTDNNIKLDEKAISEITKKNTATPLKQFVLEQQTQDKDIVKKRYWMGEDVTDKKNMSTVSLGNLTTKSKRIKIEFRDFGLIDGDRIRVFVNEKTIYENVVLSGNYFFIYIDLEKGFNKIDIKALNEGQYGPNTADINVFDDYGNLLTSNHWNLTTNEMATLSVSRD